MNTSTARLSEPNTSPSVLIEAGCAERGSAQAPHRSPLTFTLPVPPSVNQMFANPKGNRGKRYKTKTYQYWIAAARQAVAQQAKGVEMICYPILVIAQVERASLSADIDNRIKAMFDILKSEKVIKDDTLVTGFAAAWGPPAQGLCRLMIMPVQALTLDFHPSSDAATGGWFLAAQPEQEMYDGS